MYELEHKNIGFYNKKIVEGGRVLASLASYLFNLPLIMLPFKLKSFFVLYTEKLEL